MSRWTAVAASLLAPALALAQPADRAAPLAELRDEKQLADALAQITQDPAVTVADPKTRALAQALMVEGVRQLHAQAYEQALANFLEAYAKFPSPKILLNIGSTLRDMGRGADAANTYQRYLTDPTTGTERVAEVKQILLDLDQQLTILTVRVSPSGSDVSIDGGPFVPVGSALLTRVRPGLHLVRIRKGDASSEITVNGFEGEIKEVTAALQVDAPAETPASTPTPPPDDTRAPGQVDGWLITGTQYASDGTNDRERKVRAGYAGPTVEPRLPDYELSDTGEVIFTPDRDEDRIESGLLSVLRVDGEGRGFAGGLGLAFSRGRFEGEVMVLKSDSTGGYLGLRYRLLTGWVRPYVGVGVPGFAYDQMTTTGDDATKLAIGLRGAAGVELRINGHLSVQGDLGYEHFFVDEEETRIDANIFVPTLGVILRL